MTVYWTNEALTEVAEIRDYLLENAPDYAEQIIASFFSQAEQLSSFPEWVGPTAKVNYRRCESCW